MKTKGLYISVIFGVLTLCAVGYAFLLFVLPQILNSKRMVANYQRFLYKHSGLSVDINNFKFKTNPDLTFEVTADSLKNDEIFKVEALKYKSKFMSVKPQYIDADNIYLNLEELRKHLDSKPNNRKKTFELKFFPVINVKEGYIQLDSANKSSLSFKDIKSYKKGFNIICTFEAVLKTYYLNQPVLIGKSGGVHYFRKLYFDDLSVETGKAGLVLSGAVDDLNIKGQNIPAKDTEAAFLYFYKLKHPNKRNFIENFTNFSGLLDVDVNYSKKGLNGKCLAHNLGADFSKFKIPVLLPEVLFNFGGRTMDAKANGYFGSEPVYTDVSIKGMFTDSVNTVGNVRSALTDKFSSMYFKPVKIIGRANADVKYVVHKNVVDVFYSLTVPEGSNLVFGWGSLDNTDKVRKITAHTVKRGNDLYLKEYDYSFMQGGILQKLILGEGLFVKHSGHFKPYYLTLKTNGNLSTSILSPFVNNFIYCGTFGADLRYDFMNKFLTGYLNLYDVCHEDFLYLKNAGINAQKDSLKISADGTFFDSPITLSLSADNDFVNGLNVKDIDIHLNKFYVRRGGFGQSHSHKSSNVVHHKHKDYDINVQKGRIRVDEILNSRFYLSDVEIDGSMHNNIVDFVVPKTNYAKGVLSAKGKYDVKKHNSDIYFMASGIDSNEVATKMFSLPDQFEGFAYATLHLLTKDRFNDIKAYATFAIEDGLLPKLGSREIILNKSNKRKSPLYYIKKPIKFTLSKITNIDFSNKQVLSTDLQGSFILDNSDVNCVKIFSQSDYLSMFIEGNYNIDSEIGQLFVWGKHNKVAEKKIKILKVPLSWLYKIFFRVERSKNLYQDKINLIPSIKGQPQEIGVFRVKVNGNLNSNDINVELKDIRG